MGLTHLDAGVVIAFLDDRDAHHAAARRTLESALDDGSGLAMASSAFAECLVGPARVAESAVASTVEFFARVPIRVVPIDHEIALLAARLRASHRSLRLPDAFVIAAAEHHRADELVTTDRGWPAADELGTGTRIVEL